MRLLGLALLLLFGACAQFGLELRGSDPAPRRPIIVVPGDLSSVVRSLERFLRARDALESTTGDTVATGKVRLTEPWRRGTSLRYSYHVFGERGRHVAEWKGQWSLQAVDPQHTQVTLKILEVIYYGPAERAGPRPDPETIKSLPYRDWFETPPDDLRALFELRRFWTETYPRQPLPAVLADLTVPSLSGPPASREWAQSWEPLRRRPSY